MIRTRLQGDVPFFPNMLNNGKVEVCLKEDVDKVIGEKDAEIRKLRRALWVTRANMAKAEADRWGSHVDCGNLRNRKDPAFVKTGKLLSVADWRILWSKNERKCRTKAEECK